MRVVLNTSKTMPIHEKTWQKGYTLVELMVALALAMIVTIGIFKSYSSFSRSADVQDQMLEIQQNLRVAMSRMSKEIRRAGYIKGTTGGAGLVLANCTATMIEFTYDVNEDGDVADSGETIAYQFDEAANSLDRRIDGGSWQSVIPNVNGLEFRYRDSSSSGVWTTTVDVNCAVTDTCPVSVQITLLVRSTNENYSYTDSFKHVNMAGLDLTIKEGGTLLSNPPGDHYHRRVMSQEVNCPNL